MRMAKPQDPSGAKTSVTIRLSPRHLVRLDAEAAKIGTTRTALIEALIETMRYSPGVPVDVPAGAELHVDSDGPVIHQPDGTQTRLDCPHPATFPIAGGLKKCRNCDAVRGLDRTWRTP